MHPKTPCFITASCHNAPPPLSPDNQRAAFKPAVPQYLNRDKKSVQVKVQNGAVSGGSENQGFQRLQVTLAKVTLEGLRAFGERLQGLVSAGCATRPANRFSKLTKFFSFSQDLWLKIF